MFSSVLCPVDLSEQSLRTLRHAIALAAHGRGRVTVVHVVHPLLVEAAAAGADVNAVTRDIENDVRAAVTAATNDAGAWAPAIETRVTTGDAAGEITKYASDRAISLIVMGTHGLTGYRKMILGSVAERVLRNATAPVLVVPEMPRDQIVYRQDGPDVAIGRVLAPVDLSTRSAADARVASQMAMTFGVPLMLLHVVGEVSAPSRWRESLDEQGKREVARAKVRLDELASSLGERPHAETLVTGGSPADAIALVTAEHGVGLIVMGLTGESGWFGARPGTTAYRVLATAATPVLALPPPPDETS